MLHKMPQVCEWRVQDTYQCSEVGYLEGRIVARDSRDLVVPTIDLGSCSAFNQKV